jgi:sarcosine oxidase gamma subunit
VISRRPGNESPTALLVILLLSAGAFATTGCAQESPASRDAAAAPSSKATPTDESRIPSNESPMSTGDTRTSSEDAAVAASSEELETGRQYKAGSRVRAGENGVSWIDPAEWLGVMPPGTPAFLMGSETEAGLGIAYLLSGVTVQDVAVKLNETQALDETLVLEPHGEPAISGNRVSMAYTGESFDGQVLALVGPAGQGIVYFFAGPRTMAAHYADLLETLAGSTRFTSPETPPPAPVATGGQGQSNAGGPWNDLLAGMMLKQLSSYSSGTSGGYNSSRVWHLCSDGTYAYSGSSSVSIDAGDYSGGSSGQDQSQGKWSVETSGDNAVLVLASDNGETYRLSLQYDGEKTFLDGERVFRVPSDGCR